MPRYDNTPSEAHVHGIGLARRFYRDVVAPLLPDVAHAAALLGDGSEVLGFDDAISTDHNFGPRLQVFVEGHAEAVSVARRLDEDIPERFDGSAVAFPVPGMFGGSTRHQVVATTPDAFFHDLVRFDPGDGVGLADWLLTPTQRLATLTGGEVFHDPDGRLASRRHAVAWYPDDVWRYVLAAQWRRVSQEQAFVGRTGAVGDDLGSRVLATRLARDLMRLAFLIERRWAPYGKWLGGAFDELDLADEVGPHLTETLTAGMWRGREAGLCRAATLLGHATNALELAAPVDPSPRPFHERDIIVVDADGFTAALCEAIEDDEVVALLARLGRRAGNEVRWLPGAIDQAVDSTDVLTQPDRCRAAAELLGLPV